MWFLERRSRRWAGFLVAAALALAGLTAARAAQWIVDDDGPADFSTIQAAVTAVYVHSGDEVLVRPGYYTGTLALLSKDLVIRSEGGPFVTLLDARGMGSVVLLQNRSAATRIEGFTLANGEDQTGGGVWIYGGAPVVTRNVIVGNRAVGGYLGYGYGGGIEVYSSAAVITRNVIQANSALDGGGGIDVYYSGPATPGTCCPLIAQNTIVDNVVTSPSGRGGGIFVAASEPRVTSCVIAGNQAASGGGLYAEKFQGIADVPDVAVNILHMNQPDAAASNANWRLPSSNLLADPRLGPGAGAGLWPRSDSPALDAAEAGLPPGADLTGEPVPVDSDLDGIAVGDIGAVESRGEITDLRASHDPNVPGRAVLSWDGSSNPAVTFDVYAGDAGPFVSDGGTCLAASLSASPWTDAAPLPPGTARFYLVTGRGAVEGSRGLRSDLTPRPSEPSCPAP